MIHSTLISLQKLDILKIESDDDNNKAINIRISSNPTKH